MEVIPVVDLLGGEVVHARKGQRDAYRPIRTKLSSTSLPGDVAGGLFQIFHFSALYIADLDAIAGRDPNEAALREVTKSVPAVPLWIDAGLAGPIAVRRALDQSNHVVVIGSESQHDAGWTAAMRDHPRVVLSLDFRGDEFQGPPDLLDDASLWPARIVVMTLARVGAASGPDFERVAGFAARAAGRRIYAAGGTRDLADLRALIAAGASGALVATALHDGSLDAAALRSL